MPSFRSLYWADFTIRRSITAMGAGVMLVVGIWWITQPVPNALPQEVPPPEVAYRPWLVAAGVTLTALAGIVLLWRYLLIKKIICHGVTVKGTVDLVERFDTNSRSNKSRIQTTPTYAYYVTIRYTMHSRERKFRLKLLHSPGTYGMKQGEEVDLLALDWVPERVLIREVYLGGITPRRRGFFW